MFRVRPWVQKGKLHLFVAIDRTSKFAFAELYPKMTRLTTAELLNIA
jgi:hypothetical protein